MASSVSLVRLDALVGFCWFVVFPCRYPPGDWLVAAAFLIAGAAVVLLTVGKLLANGAQDRR